MDKTPTKLLILIIHDKKIFEICSDEIINLDQVKNKIKEELNYTEEHIKM